MKKPFIIYLLLSIVAGMAIAWVDSQPNWDDTGITVMTILIIAALLGFISNQKPWLIALAISVWIPLWAVIETHNYAGFLAFVPGFAGAYVGFLFKKLMS